ncbi:MAG: cysteine-rich CWC family protein [Nitrososphaerota archaeon]|nr:cysteine-rich CWC family protein [Nitrososphaerota archaeon]
MPRSLTCQLCGKAFTCEGPLSFGCWCELVKTSKTSRLELSNLTTDCVCPQCLQTFALKS